MKDNLHLMLKNFVMSATEDNVKYSYKNFHTKGMTYINLYRSERLTAKLYILKPGEFNLNNMGYLVNPHNHAYNFHTYLLTGEVRNIVFEENNDIYFGEDDLPYDDDSNPSFNKFTFESKLNGKGEFVFKEKTNLRIDYVEHLIINRSYYLDHKQVHTIFVHPNYLNVLFLVQYHDVNNKTNFYCQESEPPNLEGLYLPISCEEYNDNLETVKDLLNI